MKLITQLINKLKPVNKFKCTKISGMSLVIEQRADLIVFIYKYRSSVTLKYSHKKLISIEYRAATSEIINTIRDQCKILDSIIITGIDPIHEKETGY